MGDSGGNLSGMQDVADELREAWAGEDVVIAHIPEYYNYQDVLAYQRDQLGIDEDPRLEGLHDDYYITSIIMNDDPRHVRYDERVAAGMASINGIDITGKKNIPDNDPNAWHHAWNADELGEIFSDF